MQSLPLDTPIRLPTVLPFHQWAKSYSTQLTILALFYLTLCICYSLNMKKKNTGEWKPSWVDFTFIEIQVVVWLVLLTMINFTHSLWKVPSHRLHRKDGLSHKWSQMCKSLTVQNQWCPLKLNQPFFFLFVHHKSSWCHLLIMLFLIRVLVLLLEQTNKWLNWTE